MLRINDCECPVVDTASMLHPNTPGTSKNLWITGGSRDIKWMYGNRWWMKL